MTMRIALLTALATAGLLGSAVPAQAQDTSPPESTLSVRGEGSVRVRPDVATVFVSIRRIAVSAPAARNDANARTRRFLTALSKLGIPARDVQTSQVELSRTTIRPLHKGGPRRVRYVASNDVTVRTTRFELISPVFDAATRAGATFTGPSFGFQDPSAGRLAATRAALADARRRADDAAAAIGYHVVAVRSVSLDASNSVVQGDAAPAPAGGKATPIRPGTEEVSATADVVYVISQ